MLYVLAGLLITSVLTRQIAPFLLALAFLGVAVVSRLWARHCLERVELDRRFSLLRVPFGEEIELEIEVVNRKLLPLAWLEVEYEVPRELLPARGKLRHSLYRATLISLLALSPFERVRRRYSIPCLSRGEHHFGPARLRSGDLFGALTREAEVPLHDTVIVYPRIARLAELGLPARHPLGDLRTRSWLFEDPSRVAGAREYQTGDGLRRIHWAASAHTQRLQSRVYEPTTSHKLVIVLDLATDEGRRAGRAYDSDVLELSIVTAASLANWGLEQGYQVGLSTNGMHRSSLSRVVVKPGRAPGQLEHLLVALARLEPFDVRPLEELLAEDSSRLPPGSTVVVVAAALTPAVVAALRALRPRGHAVTAILTGRGKLPASSDGAGLDGIVVRRVGPPEAWRTVAELSPERARPAPSLDRGEVAR